MAILMRTSTPTTPDWFIRMLKTAPITGQQKRTLRGLALHGDMEGAVNGLNTIMLRRRKT